MKTKVLRKSFKLCNWACRGKAVIKPSVKCPDLLQNQTQIPLNPGGSGTSVSGSDPSGGSKFSDSLTVKPAKNIWIIDLTHGKIQAVAHPLIYPCSIC